MSFPRGPFTTGHPHAPFEPSGAAPIGAAGGDLEGTYPNPLIRLLAVTTAKINNLAVIAEKIGAEAVTSGAIKLLAVGEAQLGEKAVSEIKLAAAVIAKLFSPSVPEASKAVSVAGEEFIPSVSKSAFVNIEFTSKTATACTYEILVGGKEMGQVKLLINATETQVVTLGVLVPPNTKVSVKKTTGEAGAIRQVIQFLN